MFKAGITQSGDDFERIVERIARKTAHIADTYFKHPVRVPYVEVPFKEDELRIRFREPVDLSYIVSFRYDFINERYIQPNIWAYLDRHLATELKLTISDGRVRFIYIIYDDGDEYGGALETNAALILNLLFIPDVFGKLTGAEVSSKYGKADKWFFKLLALYRERRSYIENYGLQTDIGALYDTTAKIDRLDLYFLGLGDEAKYYFETYEYGRKHVEEEYFVLNISLLIPTNVVEIKIVVYRSLGRIHTIHTIIEEKDVVSYSLSEGRIIDRGINEDVITEFPEGAMDAVEAFLKKFFDTYVVALPVMTYMQLRE